MRRSRRWIVPLLGIALTLATAACGDSGGDATAAGRLRVVATTSVLADFAREVGGDQVQIETIIKPNVDAHDFEPAPSDIEAIRTAAVVLRNGAGLEAWFDDTIDASGTDAAVVDASTGIRLRGGDEPDPHIWHDPRNAVVMVETIESAFAAADPEHAAVYAANAGAYVAEIEALDAEIAAETGTLSDKKLVTNHDAFGYYAARYGFTIVGSVIPSFDSSAELSAADLDDLVTAIEREGVKAVFSETSLPGDAARTIADEAGVTVVVGEDALYGDGLGPEGSAGATYLAMMRHNTHTIVTNLR